MSKTFKGDDEDNDFHAVPFEQNDNEEEMDDADAKQKEKAGRNGVCGTALAIISTIMGGGIVSIPYAYAVAGVTIGISV